jgi:hypothetical protein
LTSRNATIQNEITSGSDHVEGDGTPHQCWKRRSDRNAIRHDLLSQDLILEGESRADFENLHPALIKNLPRNAMKAKKKLRGRPKKKLGELEFSCFVRAGLIMCAFDEAREGGDKHSAAITHAVEYTRQHHPEMPVSETEVKRTLATYRPKHSRTILQFKRSKCDDEKLARLRNMLEQVANVHAKINLPAPPPSIKKLPTNLKAVTFGYFERPLYPRHNRKIPKE